MKKYFPSSDLFFFSVLFLYNAYLIASLHYGVTKRTCLDFCDDVGFLFIITMLVYLGLVYYFIIKPFFKRALVTEPGQRLQKSIFAPVQEKLSTLLNYKHSSLIISSVFIVTLKIFIFYDTREEPTRLISYLGLWILVLLGLIFSKHPGMI